MEKEIINEDETVLQNRWMICCCRANTCMNCEAERQASLAGKLWSVDKDQEGAYDLLKTENLQLQSLCDTLIKYGEVIRVTYQVDDSYFIDNTSTKFVYKLHPSLAATGDYTGASGLVAFLFARKALIDPQPYSTGIPFNIQSEFTLLYIKKYHQVAESLREGREIYSANYGDTRIKMKPQDVAILVSDLGYTVVESEAQSKVMLGRKLFALKPQQILVFLRLDDYRTWSVTNCSVHSHNLVLYCCQSHNILVGNEVKEYGGIIYKIGKSWLNILNILRLIEEHSGKSLDGITTVMVFEK